MGLLCTRHTPFSPVLPPSHRVPAVGEAGERSHTKKDSCCDSPTWTPPACSATPCRIIDRRRGFHFRWAISPGSGLGDTASGLFPCKYSWCREQKKRQSGLSGNPHKLLHSRRGSSFPSKIFPGCDTSHRRQEAVSFTERLEELKIKIDFWRTKSDLTM